MIAPLGPVGYLELAIAVALVGALAVSLFRDPIRVWRWGLGFTAAAFALASAAFASFYWGSPDSDRSWLGHAFKVDELNAPLLPMLGLIHFLTALATGRTKMRRFSLAWSLISVAVRLAILGSEASWTLVALLVACVVPPYMELRDRGKPRRIYALHMSLFAVLLVVGWAMIDFAPDRSEAARWASVPLFLAILIRCGAAPFHTWITEWFEHASFGNALLFVTPLVGVYAALRMAMPIVPDGALQAISVISLLTAIYAAGLALVQNDGRRFFAYLFLSHASTILVGLELHTEISLAGALALWVSTSLSLAGFGLTLRALEARFGRLSFARFHGFYGQAPSLAVCFLLTGLASVGFPGTLGFVAGELLDDGAIHSNLFVGLGLIVASALNGISVVRVYTRLFMGKPHESSLSLQVGLRERIAVLTLAALILGGGLFPQPGIASRYAAAEAILQTREAFSRPPSDPDRLQPPR